MMPNDTGSDAEAVAVADIRALLDRWADRTRRGRLDEVLEDFSPDALIYDVLAPLLYRGTVAYRASWDAWQPETQGDGVFGLRDLQVEASGEVAFAHGLIECGGVLADGRAFEDLVRATFCLRRLGARWRVVHAHISKAVGQG